MDIGYAVQMMEEGKSVRRAAWVEHARTVFTDYATIRMEDALEGYRPMIVVRSGGVLLAPYNPTHSDLFAKDWEVDD